MPADAQGGTASVVGAAIALTVMFVAVLALPLAAASQLGLSSGQLTGWILALYGVPGALTLVMVRLHRQPLLVTSNVFMLAFIASLGTQLAWAQLVGATMLAGLAVLLLGALGGTRWLAAWLPAPIVFGLLAGAVLPFVLDIFIAIGGGSVRGTAVAGGTRLAIGGAVVAYVLGRRWLEPRLPAILPALAVGLGLAALAGELTATSRALALPVPVLTVPELSFAAVITATPVMIVLITLQANVPSLVFLRSQGYEPPERQVSLMSGVGTAAGSLLGPMGISLSLPATALTAGPEAGPHAIRHRAAVIAGVAALVVALLAGLASELATVVPPALLFALAGLALLGVLQGALQQMTAGPLRFGPMLTFAISLLPSDLSLLGLGPFFWALVVGVVTSRLLERDGWQALQDGSAA